MSSTALASSGRTSRPIQVHSVSSDEARDAAEMAVLAEIVDQKTVSSRLEEQAGAMADAGRALAPIAARRRNSCSTRSTPLRSSPRAAGKRSNSPISIALRLRR